MIEIVNIPSTDKDKLEVLSRLSPESMVSMAADSAQRVASVLSDGSGRIDYFDALVTVSAAIAMSEIAKEIENHGE